MRSFVYTCSQWDTGMGCNEEVIKIDVDAVLRDRFPGLHRLLPRCLVRRLERLICQDEMNRLLEENAGRSGADFCRGVLASLDVKVDVRYPERMPPKENRRVVFVSNHPLGGLDGMALIDLVQTHYGGQVWFVVNDMLMAVKPLEDVFIPVNKFGGQSRESIGRIDEAFAGDDPIIIFPAGLVSRYRKVPYGGKQVKMVCDLDWHKMFVTKCVRYKRDIVPLFFSGNNSMDFYRKANLRKRLGLKFNLEQLLLPREVFRSRGKTFTVTIGFAKSYSTIDVKNADGYAKSIGSEIYVMMLGIEPGVGTKEYIKAHSGR